jgi:hypothetical protein
MLDCDWSSDVCSSDLAGIHSQFVPTSFSYHPVTRKIETA